jgi:hypothetical protein
VNAKVLWQSTQVRAEALQRAAWFASFGFFTVSLQSSQENQTIRLWV